MNIMPYLIRGLATGGQFALVAIGYTMVYGILKLINFAHGDLFMVSGMLLIYLMADFPTMPPLVAIIIMIALTVLIGFLIEKMCIFAARSAPRMSVMISAIGVSYLLQNVVAYVTGGMSKQFPALPFLSDSFVLFGVKDKISVFLSPVVAIVLTVILVLIINHTKFGMSMRAVSRDFETSQLMGIKINRVISITFAIGAFLAAAGSLLYFSKNSGINHLAGSTPRNQSVHRCGRRRYRLCSRRGRGRDNNRYRREPCKGIRTRRLCRRYLLCPAHNHSRCKAKRHLRRADKEKV